MFGRINKRGFGMCTMIHPQYDILLAFAGATNGEWFTIFAQHHQGARGIERNGFYLFLISFFCDFLKKKFSKIYYNKLYYIFNIISFIFIFISTYFFVISLFFSVLLIAGFLIRFNPEYLILLIIFLFITISVILYFYYVFYFTT